MDRPSTSSRLSVDVVPFSVLTTLYRDMRKAKLSGKKRVRGYLSKRQTDTRRSLLTQFWLKIAELCGYGAELLSKRTTDDDFVPAQVFPPSESFKIICLIVPALDSAHAYLGMKESKLADAFVRALDLVPNGGDAQWLRNHKEKEYRPQKWKQDAEIVDGNFATVLKAVLTDRCPPDSTLTLGTVWRTLNALSKASRGRSRRIARSAKHGSCADSQEKKTEDVMWQDTSEEPEDGREVAIRGLVQHGTSDEVAEVSRIILKDVDIRLSEDLFLSWFHPGAKQHYTQIHDIHQLLKDCSDPNFEVGDASVQLGQYASVMLTMRPSRKHLDVICDKLRGHGQALTTNPNHVHRAGSPIPYFMMEPKLDGERLQLHKWRARPNDDTSDEYCIRTFSRRGNDSSPMYASALREAVLAGVKAENVILDGEIMIWDVLKASWLRFEDTREVSTAIAKKAVLEGASYTLKYMVFDVLYIDQGSQKNGDTRRSGNMVIRLPLYQRRLLLERIISEKEVPYGPGTTTKIEVVTMEKGHNERELTQALHRYETLGYEGVIAKHPDKPYVLAERSLDISIKLKPDYFDGGIQDLDVLILGAKYSSSRGHRTQRAGRLSSFLIGMRADNSELPQWKGQGQAWDEKMKKCKWVPVGSVGSGYSDKDLEELQKEFQGEWKPFDPKELPDHFEKRDYAPNLLQEVAKWVEPWKSVVVTVRAFEVNRRYYALRFPRMERINWEKPYHDVPTFGHLLDMDENKLPASVRPDEADVDDASALAVKKKSRHTFDAEEEKAINRVKDEGHLVSGGRNARRVIASALGADISNVPRLTTALEGLSFYVVAGELEPKERVEVKIHQLGGRFVQNFGGGLDFVVCTSSTLSKVALLKDRFSATLGDDGTCPIIHSSWIEECFARQARVLPKLNDVIFATEQLESELFEKADRFGDPWEDDTDIQALWQALEKVSKWRELKKGSSAGSDSESPEGIESRISQAMKAGGNIFHGLFFAVPETRFKLPGSICMVRSLGGKIVGIHDKRVTHVLVHSSLINTWSEEQGLVDAIIVAEDWVRLCMSSKTLAPPCIP